MGTKFEIRRKGRLTLVGVEAVASALLVTYYISRKTELDWYGFFSIAFVIAAVIMALFMGVRVFRYIFSIAFSLLWGLLGFEIAKNFSELWFIHCLSFTIFAYFSVYFHFDYFRFTRS